MNTQHSKNFSLKSSSLGVEDLQFFTGEEIHGKDAKGFLVVLNGFVMGVHQHPEVASLVHRL